MTDNPRDELAFAPPTGAQLEMNARAYKYDPNLDPIADLLEQGPAAWKGIHPLLVDRASVYKDFRDSYRKAVAANAVPDDRNAQTYQETQR